MDRKTGFIRILSYLFLLLALLCLSACVPKPEPSAITEDTVIITVDGREYMRVPLSSPQVVTIAQDNGAVNVVEVSARGAVMRSSTCENQLCVHMGEVTTDN